MRKTLIASALLGALVSASLPAQTSSMMSSPPPLAQMSTSAKPLKAWIMPLMQQFNQLPEIKAQQAKIRQAQLLIKAADKPVYNPELGVGYQNASEDTYSLDITQTLDWGDKRGIATRKAQLQAEILLADIQLERNQRLAEALAALVEQSQQAKILQFHQRQLASAKQQFEIATQQMQAGVLSQAELQLMQLELASKAAEHALAEQDAIAADAAVLGIFGQIDLPFAEFLSALDIKASAGVSPELPALKSAYQQVLLARLASEQAKADTSADPSISLSAEREGNDNKLGVALSLPIQIRNNYSEVVAAAAAENAVAEQAYLARERVVQQQEKYFQLSLPRLQRRYREWRELVLVSGAGVQAALSQQWQAGDISTSDYLQSLRQLATSYLAGLSLESALYRSWLDWMGQSGQLETYLQQLTRSATPTSTHLG